MKDNKIRAIIEAKKSGKSIAAVDFVAENPSIPAVLSKLVSSPYYTQHDNAGNRQITDVDQSTMREASSYISQKTKDADLVMELFPEMELAAQILISSVISPKDMNNTEVNYTLPSNLKIAPLTSLLIPIIKEHFEKSYKIEPLLPKILYDALFSSGSYPVVVIPENSVDDLINGTTTVSTESISKYTDKNGTFHSIGILGKPKKEESYKNFSIENFSNIERNSVTANDQQVMINDPIDKRVRSFAIPHLAVTDNFNSLKMPKIINRAREQSIDHILSQESFGMNGVYGGFKTNKLNDTQLGELFYKNKNKPLKNIVKIKAEDEVTRETIGEPLIMKLPSESVIPVYTPGNEEKHIGYFVLLDGEGNPVSRNSVSMLENDLRSRMGMQDDMNSYLLNRASKNLKTDCDKITFRQASKVYADIVEADLLARLRNGIIGPAVTISSNEEIYRIMLARTLMKQNTQLLYVPDKLMTYFAIRYNEFGVGESLLDKMRNLNSLRAMLLFAKTMAQVKNSIGRTKVNIKLDPNDPNPQKAIEIAMHEVARTRQQGLPLGINTASDLVDWVQKSGLEYGFEGHPGLPDVGFEFSEHASSYTEPSSDLSDELRKSAIMGTGLSPETVDAGFQADFATTVVANNLLLSKRVKKIQEVFIPQLTDHCRKVVLHNAYVVDLIKTIVKDNLGKVTDVEDADPIILQYKDSNKDLLIHLLSLEFLSNFEIGLSQPDTVVLKNQLEAFNTQEELLDKAVTYYISSGILTSSMVGEESSQRIDEVREIIKAHFMRAWMQGNNVLPELSEIGMTDGNGQPVIDFGDLFKSFINGMNKSIVSLLKETVPVGQAADKDINQISGGEDLGDSSVSEPSDSGGDDTGGDTDESMGDFGGDDDALGGGDDELPDLDNLT